MDDNPLTVAGAATVLVPSGSSAPCSLLIPSESSGGGTVPSCIEPPRLGGQAGSCIVGFRYVITLHMSILFQVGTDLFREEDWEDDLPRAGAPPVKVLRKNRRSNIVPPGRNKWNICPFWHDIPPPNLPRKPQGFYLDPAPAGSFFFGDSRSPFSRIVPPCWLLSPWPLARFDSRRQNWQHCCQQRTRQNGAAE